MATLIQTLQNVLAGKDPLLAPETRRIILKEVLQAYVLDYLYNHPYYRRLNFYGGTCLHAVFGLNPLGLSPHPSEALHLKVEVSQHDQVAVIQHTPVLFFGRSLVAAHFSLE